MRSRLATSVASLLGALVVLASVATGSVQAGSVQAGSVQAGTVQAGTGAVPAAEDCTRRWPYAQSAAG